MTRNVYVGALFDSILSAPSADLLAERVDSAWRTLLDSSFPDRARVLARDTAEADPDVVGLQEVARLTMRPKDAVRDELLLDYLEILLNELSALGAEYQVASICQAADAELPTRDGSALRLSVRNVLLARKGMHVSHATASCFGENLSAIAGGKGGVPITVLRGWASADVDIGERSLRIVNTHFETQPNPRIQRAQCDELIRILEPIGTPLVVMGDLNSDALGGDTPTYRTLVSSGFTDAWRSVREDDGCTCCHSSDLRDPHTKLTKRIDHVLVRGDLEVLDADVVGATSKTETGLWASDHAGVLVELRVL
ncbi:MAG TPA: endonuclease/exonuclease/phosphatase family protein [Gemmatimonadaceae bacterium]|nr:endonuclease/exonuclease/phosphatase family protein [Gemmatimonadaceae bacterium]